MSESATELDGRRLRRQNNRTAVLDALLALYREGNYQPSAAEIAERAGLSPRSLFRYFDDVDDLNRAAIDAQLARARPLLAFDVTADQPTAVKISGAVASRLRLFDTLAPTARAARISAPRHPLIAAQLTEARSYLRHQLERLFAPELARLGSASAAAVLSALDVLCSFESVELLRRDQKLSRAKTAAALEEALSRLLHTDREVTDEVPSHP